jgi:hypothetical protein
MDDLENIAPQWRLTAEKSAWWLGICWPFHSLNFGSQRDQKSYKQV